MAQGKALNQWLFIRFHRPRNLALLAAAILDAFGGAWWRATIPDGLVSPHRA